MSKQVAVGMHPTGGAVVGVGPAHLPGTTVLVIAQQPLPLGAHPRSSSLPPAQK